MEPVSLKNLRTVTGTFIIKKRKPVTLIEKDQFRLVPVMTPMASAHVLVFLLSLLYFNILEIYYNIL